MAEVKERYEAEAKEAEEIHDRTRKWLEERPDKDANKEEHDEWNKREPAKKPRHQI